MKNTIRNSLILTHGKRFALPISLSLAFFWQTNLQAHSPGSDSSNSSFTLKNGQAAPYKEMVSIQAKDFKAVYQKLKIRGYDVAGVDVKNRIIDVLLTDFSSPEYMEWPGVLFLGSKSIEKKKIENRFHSYEEISKKLEEIISAYPEITKLVSIGKSVEGREIWAIKISDRASIRESEEPVVLYNSVHHAREIATAEVALDTIYYLTSNYATDSEVNQWVNQTEIWVVPVVNPDGHMKVYTKSPFWRKNTRNGFGVDLNRNYPGSWNSCFGSSGFPFANTYRGPKAGSEPETQAMMELVKKIKPSFDISYHSYSELVLYPYGCDNSVAETADVIVPIGKKMAELFITDDGNGSYTPGTPWEILYGADGSNMDWMYSEQQVIPFVIELGSRAIGFHPSYEEAQSLIERARPSWGLLLDRVVASSAYIQLKGKLSPTQYRVKAKLLSSSTKVSVSQTHQFRADGTTQIILLPGMYEIILMKKDAGKLKEVSRSETIVGDELVNVHFEI